MNKQTILIVDDDKESVQTIKESLVLLNSNYTVKGAGDSKEALGIVEQENIDLMILNIKIADVNGQKLLSQLQNKGMWLPIVIIADEKINENNKEFKDFGIIELFKKPFLPEKIVIYIDEIMKKRGKTDLIKNFGLPAIMQLIEMEKRTGIITVKIGNRDARIFVKNGKLMDIKIKGYSTEEALLECMNSLYEDRDINIEYINHWKEKKINMSLMEMVMEASRISDERGLPSKSSEPDTLKLKKPANENLLILIDLLKSLKGVESYIIADVEGEVLAASPEDYSEDVLNSSIYLWVIGEKIESQLNSGEPVDLIYYRNAKKRLILKHREYIIVLDLTEITKFAVFKKKLNELLDKLISNQEGMDEATHK